jgi:hypothetical protein
MIILYQGTNQKTLLERNMDQSEFPYTVSGEGWSGSDGTIEVFVNGESRKTYSVHFERAE